MASTSQNKSGDDARLKSETMDSSVLYKSLVDFLRENAVTADTMIDLLQKMKNEALYGNSGRAFHIPSQANDCHDKMLTTVEAVDARIEDLKKLLEKYDDNPFYQDESTPSYERGELLTELRDLQIRRRKLTELFGAVASNSVDRHFTEEQCDDIANYEKLVMYAQQLLARRPKDVYTSSHVVCRFTSMRFFFIEKLTQTDQPVKMQDMAKNSGHEQTVGGTSIEHSPKAQPSAPYVSQFASTSTGNAANAPVGLPEESASDMELDRSTSSTPDSETSLPEFDWYPFALQFEEVEQCLRNMEINDAILYGRNGEDFGHY